MNLGHSLNIGKNSPAPVYSLKLNGSTQYATIDTVAGDIDTANGTYSAWVKFDSTSTTGTIIKSSVNSSNHITLAYGGSANEMLFIYKAGGTAKKVEHSVTVEGTGSWVHLAMTWNTSEDELKAYINGSQVGGTVGSLGTWSGTIDKSYIGRNTLSSGDFLDGNISEVAIFEDVVSISALYNGGNPVDISGLSDLIGYWKMKEGTGTAIADSSGERNTGTLINTPTWETIAP